MHRREFIHLLGGAITASALGACASSGGRPSGPIDLAAFHAMRRFAKTPFGNIAYIERGRGDVALFLHGFPLNSFQWRGALERLSPYRRCIAPDFLAAGYTEVAEGQDVGPDSQVAMLIAFLDALSISTVDLIGSDSGGMVAQLLVARHPMRVRSVLLTNCDSEIDCPPPFLLPIIAMAKAGTLVDERLAPSLDPAVARSPKGIGSRLYSDPAHPTDEAIECYFRLMAQSARRKELVHAYTIALERNALSGVEPILERSTVPARIVWGMADIVFSKESPDYLHRTFGGSRGVRRLPDRKLFWPEEIPDVLAAEALTLWGEEAHRA